MALTKKHFIAIAADFKTSIDYWTSAPHITERERSLVISALRNQIDAQCRFFKTVNPAFDSARFRAACGY